MAYQAIVTKPTNMDDVVDFRDITDRVEHLEKLRQPGPIDLGDEDNGRDQDSLFEELKQLEDLLDETRGYGGDHQWRGDWYPGSMIRDSYFEAYAEELADDIGAIDRNAKWPLNHIDWEAAARDLQQDYGSVDWNDVTYWYR